MCTLIFAYNPVHLLAGVYIRFVCQTSVSAPFRSQAPKALSVHRTWTAGRLFEIVSRLSNVK